MPAELLPTMTFFATLLGFGVLVTAISRKARIPNALFLLLVGLVFGPSFLNLVDIGRMGDIPEFLRTLALIVIIFASSFHLKLSVFKRVSRVALALSFGGFFFTMFFMGFFAHLIFELSWMDSFLLSSIIGGTSSAAVYTFRKALEKEKDVLELLTIESIFSDPLTVLVPVLILSALFGTGTAGTVVISQFWQMLAAGVGTGVIVGFAAGEAFRKSERELSAILSFSIALITYALASNVGGSGILAVAIAAMILGNLKIPYKEEIGEFEDSLSIVLTISVFTFLGAQIALNLNAALLVKEIFFVGVLIFLARPIFTTVLLWKNDLKMKERFIIAFTSPRGVASAAVAALPLATAVRLGFVEYTETGQLILLTVFLVVFFTLLSSTIADTLLGTKTKKKGEKEEEPEEKDTRIEILKELDN